MAKKALILGRFSTYHHGHDALINYALKNYDSVLVIIGSAKQARSIKNPFSDLEREQVIRRSWTDEVHEGRLVIRTARDYPYNPTQWGSEICSIVDAETLKGDEWSIVGCNKDDSSFYLFQFPQWEVDLFQKVGGDLDATTFRKHLFENVNPGGDISGDEYLNSLPEETVSFLKWYVGSVFFERQKEEYQFVQDYKKKISVFPYPVTINTADAVIIQSNHVLVIERKENPGKGLIALPGGHVDLDETLHECAIREAYEETGITIAGGKRSEQITKDILRMSIKACRTFDHPERSMKARVITEAILISLDDSKPLPSLTIQESEVVRAFWMPLGEALSNSEMWMEDHWHILKWAVSQR